MTDFTTHLIDDHFHIDFAHYAQKLPIRKERVDDPIKDIIQSAIDASLTIAVRVQGQEWTGSGFHLGDGFIATASHVAPPEIAQEPHMIGVTVNGRDFFKAQLVASDPNIDSGVLYCPDLARVVPAVTLGDSDTLEVGDIIAVIGSPEGFHDTATVGRVSNIHQGLGEMGPSPAWSDIIFIDAKILQGVSGGMVIATDGLCFGSVMGVTGQNANVGIGENAVCPSNKIKALLHQARIGQ